MPSSGFVTRGRRVDVRQELRSAHPLHRRWQPAESPLSLLRFEVGGHGEIGALREESGPAKQGVAAMSPAKSVAATRTRPGGTMDMNHLRAWRGKPAFRGTGRPPTELPFFRWLP